MKIDRDIRMIHGIGIDFIDERRIRPLLDTPSDSFFQKTYTEAERMQAEGSVEPIRYYAERFAAKEAVFKALRISGDGVRLNEIETLNDDTGAPYVKLYGYLEQCRQKMGISAIHISITRDPPYSLAYVICETNRDMT